MTKPIQKAIYERVLQSCQPVPWPDDWSWLPESAAGLVQVGDDEELEASLLDEFEGEDLKSAGVMELTVDDEYVLAETIVESPLLALHEHQSTRCTDILTQTGCLTGRTPALLVAIDDEHTEEHLEDAGGRIFIAADLRDVALLRALGLPAVSAEGLHQMTAKQIARLSRHAGWMRKPGSPVNLTPSEEREALSRLAQTLRDRRDKPRHRISRLTLVAWSPWQVSSECPSIIEMVIKYFSDLSKHLRLDVSPVEVWRPTEEELERFHFVANLHQKTDMRRALLDSVRDSVWSLAELESPDFQLVADPDYRTACSVLVSAAGENPERFQAAQTALTGILESQIVGPLIEEAKLSTNASIRALGLQLAELTRLFFQTSWEVTSQSSRGSLQPSGDQDARYRRINTMLQISKATAALKKQLDEGAG